MWGKRTDTIWWSGRGVPELEGGGACGQRRSFGDVGWREGNYLMVDGDDSSATANGLWSR